MRMSYVQTLLNVQPFDLSSSLIKTPHEDAAQLTCWTCKRDNPISVRCKEYRSWKMKDAPNLSKLDACNAATNSESSFVNTVVQISKLNKGLCLLTCSDWNCFLSSSTLPYSLGDWDIWKFDAIKNVQSSQSSACCYIYYIVYMIEQR